MVLLFANTRTIQRALALNIIKRCLVFYSSLNESLGRWHVDYKGCLRNSCIWSIIVSVVASLLPM